MELTAAIEDASPPEARSMDIGRPRTRALCGFGAVAEVDEREVLSSASLVVSVFFLHSSCLRETSTRQMSSRFNGKPGLSAFSKLLYCRRYGLVEPTAFCSAKTTPA